MWSLRSEHLPDSHGLKLAIDLHSSPVSYAEVLRRWRTDASFRTFFMTALADVPYFAFRWETPPISTASMERTFECVVLDSPDLDRPSDPNAFASHFSAGRPVVEFANLGRDAIMVVPCP